MSIPADTGVIKPVDEFIVAMALLEEVHEPPLTVEENVAVPFKQIDCVPLNVPVVGGSVTVRIRVALTVVPEQTPEPETVYVIVSNPADKVEIIPEEEPMVATDGLDAVQTPPGEEDVNVGDEPKQTNCVPFSVPAKGAAVMVTVLVAVAFAQPPVPATVYVNVSTPEETGVTTPVEGFIVAIEVLLEIQEPPLSVEDKVVVLFEQISCVPLNVPALGCAVIDNTLIAEAFKQTPVPAIT